MSSREVVQLVEIRQPLCQHVYGQGPCTATGPAAEKCYNTRATCQDTANFSKGTPLSLFFAKGHVAEQNIVPYCIPSLVSVSTAPTVINFAGLNPDAQGLGNRATCSIVLADHPHNDRVVDPYLSDRDFDPAQRSSFWYKWLARNLHRQKIEVIVYDGYAGQTLAEMVSRTYFLDKITGPSGNGRVTISGKDVLAQAEEREAQCPVASKGVLYTGIDDSQTSFEVAGAIASEYDAAGTVRIGDEFMTYTGVATSANGIEFTGVVRGTDKSEAATHDVDAGVQQCYRVTDMRGDLAIADLLENYANIDSAWLNKAGWDQQFETYRQVYRLTELISEPTGVNKLVSQIVSQCGVYIWWDERTREVQMSAIRGLDGDVPVVTGELNIIEDSVSTTEDPREWATRCVVHYNRRDFIKSVDDVSAYESSFVLVDADAEAAYEDDSTKTIFGNWLRFGALAENTASKIITRFNEVPRRIRFRLDAKDRTILAGGTPRDIWTGVTVTLDHFSSVDFYGQNLRRNWTIISAEEVEPGHVMEFVAEDTTLYGRVYYITGDAEPDYSGDNPDFLAFIGEDNGLLPDGTMAATIS